MLNNITLTASMRSNLLSLKNIATQMNKTQNILATGKKVNSAIDNASNYYQARSLTNRANDLNALLDSMSQGIQTIQTATQGLDHALTLVEQATAVATQAYETATIPAKEWFEEQVGPNGAVVTTAQELKDAINANKETICVYGKIDYFEGESITLKNNQKLVGVGYFGDFDSDIDKFSYLRGSAPWQFITCFNTSNTISDLSIELMGSKNNSKTLYGYVNCDLKLNNLDLIIYTSDQSSGIYATGLCVIDGKADLRGNINIRNHDNRDDYLSIWIENNAQIDIYDNLNTQNKIVTYGSVKPSIINMHETSKVYTKYINLNRYNDIGICDELNIKAGAEIGFNDNEKYYKVLQDFSVSVPLVLKSSNIEEKLSVVETQKDFIKKLDFISEETISQMTQYSTIMSEFDKLVVDSSYQGVNLLTGGELKVTFNETRTHELSVKGKDMRSEKLGVKTKKWNTKGDVAEAIKEVASAVKTMRNFQSELGTNYSIIQTRQNFTDALSDILETGADDLVLADMNETSAEYLMLQTRQQLAVNSLSLASQSASSILSLF